MKIAKRIRAIWDFVLDCFFVPACPVCRAPENEVLCNRCRDRLEKLFDPWPVIRQHMDYDMAYSAFFFSDEAVRSLVYCLKMQGTKHAVCVAADAMEQIVSTNVTLSGVDVITWLPRSEAKIIDLGFDQSRLLAEELSRRTGIPCRQLLYRKRDNKVQHRLSMQDRKANVKDCFECREKVFCGDVLLIDDVITSGASVNEGAKVLKKSGYDFVRALSLASTDRRIAKSENK